MVGMQTSTATMENSVEIPKKLEIELPYDSATPMLGRHSKPEMKETHVPQCSLQHCLQ